MEYLPYPDKNIDNDNEDGCSSDGDYDGGTSSTETDDESYNEDYFLDMGFGELMLQTSVSSGGAEHPTAETPESPTDTGESSMWCSNLDKFSNILRSSMTNLHVADSPNKPSRVLQPMTSIEDVDRADVSEETSASQRMENSDTESQQTAAEDGQLSEHDESSEEERYYPKPLSKTNMAHYYLSSTNLLNTE